MKMVDNALFTSNTDMWATPQDLFDKLNKAFRFETDVCAIASCLVAAKIGKGVKE